jgi:hypothetical protein
LTGVVLQELLTELLACNDEICQALDFYKGVLDGSVQRRPPVRTSASLHDESFANIGQCARQKYDEDSASEPFSTSQLPTTPSNQSPVADLLGLGFGPEPVNRRST